MMKTSHPHPHLLDAAIAGSALDCVHDGAAQTQFVHRSCLLDCHYLDPDVDFRLYLEHQHAGRLHAEIPNIEAGRSGSRIVARLLRRWSSGPACGVTHPAKGNIARHIVTTVTIRGVDAVERSLYERKTAGVDASLHLPVLEAAAAGEPGYPQGQPPGGRPVGGPDVRRTRRLPLGDPRAHRSSSGSDARSIGRRSTPGTLWDDQVPGHPAQQHMRGRLTYISRIFM